MRAFVTLYTLFQIGLVRAHHTPDHIKIEIDPTLSPPTDPAYLWIVLGPMAVAITIGVIRALLRYRRRRH